MNHRPLAAAPSRDFGQHLGRCVQGVALGRRFWLLTRRLLFRGRRRRRCRFAFFRSLGGCGFGRFLLRHGRSPDTRFMDRIAAFAMPVHVSYLGTGKTSRSFDCLFAVFCQVVPTRKELFLRHSAHVIPMSLSTSGSKVRIPSRDLVIELRNPTRQLTDARDSAGAVTSRLYRGNGRKAMISAGRESAPSCERAPRMLAPSAQRRRQLSALCPRLLPGS